MSLRQKVKYGLGAAVIAVAMLATPGVTYADGAGSCPEGSVRAGDAIDGDKIKSVADCNVAGVDEDNGELGLQAVAVNLINVVIGILGLIAVFVVVLGGIQYTTSTGDAGKIKKARDTILYGIIGVVVAVFAFAIVNFVLANV